VMLLGGIGASWNNKWLIIGWKRLMRIELHTRANAKMTKIGGIRMAWFSPEVWNLLEFLIVI
jgi:hypothetical protein